MLSQDPLRRTRLFGVQFVVQALPSLGAPEYELCQQSSTHSHTFPCMS